MGRTQDDNDKVDELTSGLDELKTTVEELELETATDIDAERLAAVKSALELSAETPHRRVAGGAAVTMIAAIYARKSTDQAGVAEEQKSVARQVEHAIRYAETKGWTVADEHVYVDDGISGAEFAKRPGFLRLMNALKSRPTFQVLVMSEDRGSDARRSRRHTP